MIGAAFYARVYAAQNKGVDQPAGFRRFYPFKNYETVFTAANGYETAWDEQAKAPWSYSAGKKLYATYDNKRSVQLKTQYALDKKLAGIMFWELRQDLTRNGLLQAIHEAKTN